MTIRSGGRPRDSRSQAHPIEQNYESPSDVYEPPPDWGKGGGRSRGGGGIGGLIKFLVFAIVLAAIVLVLAATALRPIVRQTIVGWAGDNPGALGVPFVADLVREDIGEAMTKPASSDGSQVGFVVETGETTRGIAERLEEEGLLSDRRAFIYIAVERGLAGSLGAGSFVLRKSMTPDQLVTALLDPPEIRTVDIALRTGLRLEQITAKLQTIDGLTMSPAEFYELAKHPPAELLADYPWLELPAGASLEGYLWPATYRVLPDTTAEELIRQMLDGFQERIGDRMTVPEARGLTFHQVLSLASIVEKEAVLDEERPLIAGVYQNRLDGKNGHTLLQADPTVLYANDSVELAARDFDTWPEYAFWTPPGPPMADIVVPEELQGYQTYLNGGLIPGPIATPTLASIDAALAPDTKEGFVYFVAKNDGTDGHAFARNAAEHEANLVKYGYR